MLLYLHGFTRVLKPDKYFMCKIVITTNKMEPVITKALWPSPRGTTRLKNFSNTALPTLSRYSVHVTYYARLEVNDVVERVYRRWGWRSTRWGRAATTLITATLNTG